MTTLKEGDKAPEFKVINELGEDMTLADFSGKKLVLYFYPKDSTPGCTAESCNLRDHYADLKTKGFEVLGVSADGEASHQKFIKKYELPFHLLADTEKEVLNAYGVFGPKKFMGRTFDGIHRTTFVIDENGMIERIFTKVKTKEHTEQILESYQ
ncbi:MAG: thioredoxin-dependent thiol peroxidase [Flavobacteriales bacterium]|nr:thioredoxin-dependent thiol peroxidase [Flavobacteriales bacterium]